MAEKFNSGIAERFGVTAALLLERFNAGGTPIAVVSMDNCSHNGEKLAAARAAGAGLVLVERPPDEGEGLEEILEQIKE